MGLRLTGFQTMAYISTPKTVSKPAKPGRPIAQALNKTDPDNRRQAKQTDTAMRFRRATTTSSAGDSFTPKKTAPLLAIIDDFESPAEAALVKNPHPLLREARTNGWVSHGDIVEAHAKMAQPGVQIIRVETPRIRSLDLHTLGKHQADLPGALKMLQKRLETDTRIDAINISFGLSIPIQRLKTDLNLPDLKAHNIRKYREVILKNIDQIQFAPPILGIKGLSLKERHQKAYIREVMTLLEDIARKKPVYISAGNMGPEQINILSLVKGVKTVGAINDVRTVAPYSSNSSLVSHWAKANQRFAPIKDNNGILTGLTLMPGNGGFIPRERLQMRHWVVGGWPTGLKGASINSKLLHGTSFASPQVAANQARQIFWLRKFLGIQTETQKP